MHAALVLGLVACGDDQFVPPTLEISPTGLSFAEPGMTGAFQATVHGAPESTPVRWTVSDTTVVITEVGAAGRTLALRGVRAGVATVTATLGGAPAITASASVVVYPRRCLRGVLVTPSSVTVAVGASARLQGRVASECAVTPEDVVLWRSAQPTIMTVDSSGVVTGVSPGTGVIIATSSRDPGTQAEVTVTVTAPAAP